MNIFARKSQIVNLVKMLSPSQRKNHKIKDPQKRRLLQYVKETSVKIGHCMEEQTNG